MSGRIMTTARYFLALESARITKNICCDGHTRTPRYYHGTIIFKRWTLTALRDRYLPPPFCALQVGKFCRPEQRASGCRRSGHPRHDAHGREYDENGAFMVPSIAGFVFVNHRPKKKTHNRRLSCVGALLINNPARLVQARHRRACLHRPPAARRS